MSVDHSPYFVSNGDSHQNDPRFSKTADGVRYSQKLIPFYHVTIILIIASIAIKNWLDILSRRWTASSSVEKQSQCRAAALQVDTLEADERALIKPSDNEIASSSSSTLSVSTTESHHVKSMSTEQTPLLSSSRHTRSSVLQAYLKLRATLMHQPPPIPLIHRQFPDNGTTLFILLLLGLNVFFLFYRSSLEIVSVFAYADRAAVLFAANLPYLYLLAAKNQPLELLVGRSYESLNILHRRLGEWLCLLALIHTLGMFVFWYTGARPMGWTLANFVTHRIILLGLFAFLCYELLYLTSLSFVRQRVYEFFLASHIILQAAALALVYLHHPRSRVQVGIALAIFLFDRAWRVAFKTRTYSASVEVVDAKESWLRVRANLTEQDKAKTWGTLAKGWRPTQHVYISVPNLSAKHMLQAHPFTIASPAPMSTNSKDKNLELLVRAHDGFTRDLFVRQATLATKSIRLDGPYGSSHVLDSMATKSAVVVVAAGTGIAVAIPLLSKLSRQQRQPFGTSRPSQYPFRQRLALIGVVRSRTLLQTLQKEYLDQLEQAGVQLVLPSPTEEAGRPNIPCLLDEQLHYSNFEQKSMRQRSYGVVCSAPDAMNRSVRDFCAREAWRGVDVEVCVEKFGW